MPSIIHSLLRNTPFTYFARIVLTFMFWASGLAKLIDFQAGTAEMAHFGLNPPALLNTLVLITQLGGSLLIILNKWAWLGAGALAVFTALTIPIAHDFWTMEEPMKTLEFYVVVEHVSIIGALMVVAYASVRRS